MTNNENFFSVIETLGVRPANRVERRLLTEYGSMFVAKNVQHPPCIVFPDEESVTWFQSRVVKISGTIGGIEFQLQEQAMAALLAAVDEAASAGLSISPRGPESGSRNYAGTVALWASRIEPALDHWLALGRITHSVAEEIRSATPFKQVEAVLALEESGIYFAKDLSKSVLYSVAPPGSSQHLSMLAFDVAEFDQPGVRSILENHGWFQTVTSDLPHFTYLGMRKMDLVSAGLKRVDIGDRDFWVLAA